MNKLKNQINLLLKNQTFVKYQPIFIPVVSILLCFIIFFSFTLPQFFKIQSNQKTLNDLEGKNNFYSDKLSALGKIEAQSYRDNLSAALIALPDDRDIPGVIGLINQSLSSSGLILEGITFAAPTAPTPGINNYQIRLQVSGDLGQLKDFAENIKQLPRVMKLSYVEFNSSLGGSIDASLELTAYYQPLPASIGSIDDPLSLLSENDMKNLEKLRGYLTPSQPQSQPTAPAGPVGKPDPFN